MPASISCWSISASHSESRIFWKSLIVREEVGAVEHAHVRDVVGEIARVGDVHHVGTLADHLVDVLAGAELLAGEHLDLDPSLGSLVDVGGEVLGRQMRRLAGRQRMGEADGVVRRLGVGPAGEHQGTTEHQPGQSVLHRRFLR